MRFLGLIPSRYASTRFPGKPLADIEGKSMIRRVYEQVSQVLTDVYVATDDERIAQHMKSFGGKVVMTASTHRSGTDRCAEAVQIIHRDVLQPFDIVINIQGDEPFIQPSQIELLKGCFKGKENQIATLVKKIASEDDLFNPNIPKVILNRQKEAIYFSRSTIPYLRNAAKEEWLQDHIFYKHIGIYAYRFKTLLEITQLYPSSLELAESLEQNRWIENGYRIQTAETDTENLAVDTPADLEKVKKFLESLGMDR